MTPPETPPQPEMQQASFAAPYGSAAVEAARFRLVGKACMYAAARSLADKAPELLNNSCFQGCLIDAKDGLCAAAVGYFAAVCEPPNSRVSEPGDKKA